VYLQNNEVYKKTEKHDSVSLMAMSKKIQNFLCS